MRQNIFLGFLCREKLFSVKLEGVDIFCQLLQVLQTTVRYVSLSDCVIKANYFICDAGG